jgi:hypothetical protein
MVSSADTEDMLSLLVIIGVLAFFPLAVLFGRDSRPYDPRARRWL